MPQNAGPRIPCLASTNAWRTRAMRPLPSDGSVVYVDPDGNATAPEGGTGIASQTQAPDGTVTVVFGDGSKSITRPDGSVVYVDPDGNATAPD